MQLWLRVFGFLTFLMGLQRAAENVFSGAGFAKLTTPTYYTEAALQNLFTGLAGALVFFALAEVLERLGRLEAKLDEAKGGAAAPTSVDERAQKP